MIMPDYKRNTLYNLSCSISKSLGLGIGKYDSKIELKKDKTILILLDGFGKNIVDRIGIKDHYEEFTSVFPSTTATALASLYTSMTPSEHGILGYTTYSRRYGIIHSLKYMLPEVSDPNLIKRISGKSMADMFGITSSIGKELRAKSKKSVFIVPTCIAGTEYSKAIYGTSNYLEYRSIYDAIYLLKTSLNSNPDFLSLYIPHIDNMAHRYGPYAEPTLDAGSDIYSKIKKVVENYTSEYNVIITADHGFVEVSDYILIDQDLKMINSLDAPPYGDARAIFMRSRNNMKFLEKKYKNFKVFDKSEILSSNLLGFENNDNVPDYIGVPLDNSVYLYRYKGGYTKHKGHHGSLLEDEMKIPVFIL